MERYTTATEWTLPTFKGDFTSSRMLNTFHPGSTAGHNLSCDHNDRSQTLSQQHRPSTMMLGRDIQSMAGHAQLRTSGCPTLAARCCARVNTFRRLLPRHGQQAHGGIHQPVTPLPVVRKPMSVLIRIILSIITQRFLPIILLCPRGHLFGHNQIHLGCNTLMQTTGHRMPVSEPFHLTFYNRSFRLLATTPLIRPCLKSMSTAT